MQLASLELRPVNRGPGDTSNKLVVNENLIRLGVSHPSTKGTRIAWRNERGIRQLPQHSYRYDIEFYTCEEGRNDTTQISTC